MNEVALIKKLSQLEKGVFTLRDLEKVLPVKKESLPTTVCRLVKRGVLQRLGRGLYSVFGQTIIPEEVAPILYYPSYLSLNTVLAQEGVINQLPRQVLLVTPKKTKKIKLASTLLVYRQIKKDLFFGWHLEKQVPLAYPEKALLDLIYFVSLGKAYISLEELDLSRLNLQRWQKFKTSFPPITHPLIKQVEKKLKQQTMKTELPSGRDNKLHFGKS